jgi:hypothetical protein
MTDIPFVTNGQSAASGKKADSIFRRSDGQTARRPDKRVSPATPNRRGQTATSIVGATAAGR